MKNTCLLPILLSALLLFGCAAAPEPVAGEPDSDSTMDFELDELENAESAVSIAAESDAPPLGISPELQQQLDSRQIVMDAMQYRGIVDEVTPNEDGTYSLVLHKAEGTGYSFATLNAVTDEYTRANFELDTLKAGNYLEVYISESLDGNPVTIIAANLLPDADLCVYNGELLVFQRDGDGSGTMELQDLDGEGRILFHFDDSTQFYLNMDSLEPGAMLNIFHSGATTRSIPPQGFALEVRPYAGEE